MKRHALLPFALPAMLLVAFFAAQGGCLSFLMGAGGQPAPEATALPVAPAADATQAVKDAWAAEVAKVTAANAKVLADYKAGQAVGSGIGLIPGASGVLGIIGVIAALIERLRRRKAEGGLTGMIGAVQDAKHALDDPAARTMLLALADSLDKSGQRPYVHALYRALYPVAETPGLLPGQTTGEVTP